MRVVTTPEADTHIRSIDGWWRANRAASPGLFVEELAAAFDLIARAPEIGRPYRHPSIIGIRRVLLRTTRYHVYYISRGDDAVVLTVWHARRGMGPTLESPPTLGGQ